MVKRPARTDTIWLEIIRELVRRTAGKTGRPFLEALCAALTEVFGVDFAFVSGDPPAAGSMRTIALCEKAALLENIEYELHGTPCGVVFAEGARIYASGAAGLFPDDEILRAHAIEGYAAVPLVDDEGRCTGIMGVMNRRPLRDGDLLLAALDVLACQASAELGRRRADRALARSEARSSALLEAFPDMVFRLDGDGRILDWKGGIGVRPFAPPEQFLGRRLGEVLPREPAEAAQGAIRAALEGSAVEVAEYRLPENGGWRDYEARCVACGDDEVICFVRDVTERSRLLDAQRLESLGVLAGGVAHEFNNLLVAILGNAGLALRDTSAGSAQWQYLNDIESAARRAADLAAQMLAFSGRGHFEMRSLDLARAIEDTRELVQLAVPRRIALRFATTVGLPAVRADPGQLRQLLLALVTNAAEAGAESIRVSTSLVVVDTLRLQRARGADNLSPGDYVRVEVRDDGGGMPDPVLPRVFEPFFTTRGAGRGLGLPAVLGIVRGHGGAIEIVSSPGGGTSVSVLLPTAPAKEEGAPAAAPPGADLVLVVDDEETVRSVLEHMLASLGRPVLLARDGVEAVRLFRQRHAEIGTVLLDLTMPRLGGDEVFREIRSMRKGVRIVLMSGYDEDAAVDLVHGAEDRFLHKPFTLDELRARL